MRIRRQNSHVREKYEKANNVGVFTHVRHVSQAERDGVEMKRVVLEWQRLCVSLEIHHHETDIVYESDNESYMAEAPLCVNAIVNATPF